MKLRADVAAQICIILNELATNAQKHGARDGGPVTMTLKVPPITEIESAVHVSIKEEFSTKYALSKKLFKLSSSERVGCGGCALP